MMGIVRCIRQELKKNLYLPYVFLALAGILALAFASPGDAGSTEGDLSIFSLMLQQGEAEGIGQSALLQWENGIGGWLGTLLPFLTSFGYISVLSGERQGGYDRFLLMRSGNFRYCVSKVMGGALYGGAVFALGYAVFGLFMVCAFPPFSAFPFEEQEFYLQFWGTGPMGYVAGRMAGAFLYGIAASAFGIGVSILFRDKYMLLCLPFLINYLYCQTVNKLAMDDIARGGNLSELIWSFSPQSLLEVYRGKGWLVGFAWWLAVYGGLTLLFYRIVTGEGRSRPRVCFKSVSLPNWRAGRRRFRQKDYGQMTDSRLRVAWNISCLEFQRWVRHSRLVILGVMLVFIHILIGQPLQECAGMMGERLSYGEAFVALGNSGAICLVVPILFLVLIAEFPQKDGIDLFYQIRCSKKDWIYGQVIFAVCASASIILFLVFASGMMLGSGGEWNISFSHASTHFLSAFPEHNGSYVARLIPENVYQQMGLCEAVGHTFLLMFFYFLILALALLLSALHGKKYLGVAVNGFLIVMGAAAASSRIKEMWLFPMAHALPAAHYDGYLSRAVFPLWGSYLFLAGASAALFLCCLASAKRYQVC